MQNENENKQDNKTRICGTVNNYKYGCRCDECRRANREYQRIIHSGYLTIPPMLSYMMLEDLFYLYTVDEICELTGLNPSIIYRIMKAEGTRMVHRSTYDPIYELWMKDCRKDDIN